MNIPLAVPTSLREVFECGMSRELPELLSFPAGPVLNLGAGKKTIPGTVPLDADMGWRAPDLPVETASVAGAFAFHFFEHLSKEEVLGLLRELERVMLPGGSVVTVTPHRLGALAYQDLDHKTFWTETTFHNLFDTRFYSGTMPREWKFRIHLSVVMGLVERNLVVVTQLVRM
jgi:hypothetical protein